MTAPAGPAALHTTELYRFYRSAGEEVAALRGVTIRIEAGEIIVVTGPSGSGKSSLLALLAGVDEPDGGTVWVAGQQLSHQPEAQRAALRARSVGLLFQSGNLLDFLSVIDNVRLAASLGGGTTPPVELLDRLGIADRAGARPGQLSGGQAARAGLAVALANDPAVMLADEPTGELDRDAEDVVLGLLRDRARAGGAVLVASHSPAVARAADRVVALRDGRVVAGATP